MGGALRLVCCDNTIKIIKTNTAENEAEIDAAIRAANQACACHSVAALALDATLTKQVTPASSSTSSCTLPSSKLAKVYVVPSVPTDVALARYSLVTAVGVRRLVRPAPARQVQPTDTPLTLPTTLCLLRNVSVDGVGSVPLAACASGEADGGEFGQRDGGILAVADGPPPPAWRVPCGANLSILTTPSTTLVRVHTPIFAALADIRRVPAVAGTPAASSDPTSEDGRWRPFLLALRDRRLATWPATPTLSPYGHYGSPPPDSVAGPPAGFVLLDRVASCVSLPPSAETTGHPVLLITSQGYSYQISFRSPSAKDKWLSLVSQWLPAWQAVASVGPRVGCIEGALLGRNVGLVGKTMPYLVPAEWKAQTKMQARRDAEQRRGRNSSSAGVTSRSSAGGSRASAIFDLHQLAALKNSLDGGAGRVGGIPAISEENERATGEDVDAAAAAASAVSPSSASAEGAGEDDDEEDEEDGLSGTALLVDDATLALRLAKGVEPDVVSGRKASTGEAPAPADVAFRLAVDEVASEPWFAARLSRAEAEARLASRPHNPAARDPFVVRHCSQPRALALTHRSHSTGVVGHGVLHHWSGAGRRGWSIESSLDTWPTLGELLASLFLDMDEYYPDGMPTKLVRAAQSTRSRRGTGGGSSAEEIAGAAATTASAKPPSSPSIPRLRLASSDFDSDSDSAQSSPTGSASSPSSTTRAMCAACNKNRAAAKVTVERTGEVRLLCRECVKELQLEGSSSPSFPKVCQSCAQLPVERPHRVLGDDGRVAVRFLCRACAVDDSPDKSSRRHSVVDRAKQGAKQLFTPRRNSGSLSSSAKSAAGD